MIREKLGMNSTVALSSNVKKARKAPQGAVVLGLTATATKATQKSICNQFNI
jgi:superfamily II DNA helicase RecQ